MKEQTALRLTHLFDMGYLLHISGTGYSTGFVTAIGREDYDVDDSPFVYSDDTFDDRLLSEVNIADVKVMKLVDIWEKDNDEEPLPEDFENREWKKGDPLVYNQSEEESDDDDEPLSEGDEYHGECAQCKGGMFGQRHWASMGPGSEAYICTTCWDNRARSVMGM